MIPTLYRGVARQQVGLCEQNLHSFGQSGHRQNLQSVCVADRCLYFCSLPFLSFTPHQTSQYNVQKIASFCRTLSPGFLAGKCSPWPYWGLLSSRSPMDVNLLSKSWIRPVWCAKVRENAVPTVLLMLNNIVLALIRCQPALMQVNHWPTPCQSPTVNDGAHSTTRAMTAF